MSNKEFHFSKYKAGRFSRSQFFYKLSDARALGHMALYSSRSDSPELNLAKLITPLRRVW